MHPCIIALLSACFLLLLFLRLRKSYVIHQIKKMSISEKLRRLDEMISPFGFRYMLTQDIFTSRLDAWQRDYGYCRLYDKQSPRSHMIFDCEPIYFDYGGRTWLIEFWKGQYGICAGGEIGIYRAEGVIPEEERPKTLFSSVSDAEMPYFSISLLQDNIPICRLCQKHWWLTGFCLNRYAGPSSLCMKISITFPDGEMRRAFTNALTETGYSPDDIYCTDDAAAFTFDVPRSPQPRLRRSLYGTWVLYMNRLLLFFFRASTQPFRFTIDRLLLLCGYLPFLMRRILTLHTMKRKKDVIP